MNFKNMTIRAKLIAAFAGLSMMVLFAAALSLKSLADSNERFAYLTMVTPLDLYMTRLKRRNRQKAPRSTRLVPLAKPLRGRTH